MNQVDWIGSTTQKAAFKDIRNQRASVAEEKARLCLRLGQLVNRVPPRVMSGGIVLTRDWRAAREKAAAVLASSRSSIPDLTIQIENMGRFWDCA